MPTDSLQGKLSVAELTRVFKAMESDTTKVWEEGEIQSMADRIDRNHDGHILLCKPARVLPKALMGLIRPSRALQGRSRPTISILRIKPEGKNMDVSRPHHKQG